MHAWLGHDATEKHYNIEMREMVSQIETPKSTDVFKLVYTQSSIYAGRICSVQVK